MASTLTADHIVAIYPDPNSVTKEQAEVYLPHFIAACREFGITDKNRVAGFLGQLGEESGEFVYFEELWDPTPAQETYEGRANLGNTEPGDGFRFRGSGPIQITGRANTTRVCHALGLPVDPDLLRQSKDGFRAAAYFWTNMGNDLHDTSNNGATNLNRFADVGDQRAMTYGVNGGFTNEENRDRYYNKAMEILPDDLDLSGGEQTVTEPAIERSESVADHITLGYNEQGWAYDTASGLYVKSNTADLAHNTNKDGWLWAKVETVQQTAAETVQTVAETVQTVAPTWSWPEAWDDPIPDSGSYWLRHPTRYVWRPDVEAWARWLVDNYNVWCNSYYEHPGSGQTGVPGRGFEVASTDDDGTVWYIENTSLDVWGLPDRGNPLGLTVGWQIFRYLMDYPDPPNIRWIIWQETQYGAWNGWQGEPFGVGDPIMAHWDHIHVTFE